jgi:hypothetical protein
MVLGTVSANWARALNTAVTHLPLLLAVLLSGPALIVCPFLPRTWQKNEQTLVQNLRLWHTDILRGPGPEEPSAALKACKIRL